MQWVFCYQEVNAEKQVRMILAGLKDSPIRDWVASEHAHIQLLSFTAFMIEFHQNYLDKDWEADMCCDLLAMTQGSSTFWDFTLSV
jgi:hypothetical protein